MIDLIFASSALDAVWKLIPDKVGARWPIFKEWRSRVARIRSEAGRRAYRENKLEVALEKIEQAEKLDSHPDYLNDLGQIHYERGEWAQAIPCFQKVLGIDFNNSKAVKGMAYSLHAEGRTEEAIYFYLRYLDKSENFADSAVHDNLIEALLSSGKTEDAITAAERACTLFPGWAVFPHALARSHYIGGNFEAAIENQNWACALEPGNSDFQNFLGLVRATLGDLHGALASYQEAARLNPENAEAFLKMSDLFDVTGQVNEFYSAARRARELYEAQGEPRGLKNALWGEGWASYRLGKWSESIQASRKALQIDPNMASVNFNLALALLRNGDSEQAQETYEQALALGDAAALKNDGIRDLEEALRIDSNLAGGREVLLRLKKRYEEIKPRSLSARIESTCQKAKTSSEIPQVGI